MKRTILALAVASLSVAAYASPPPGGGPPGPIDVNVTNPVLPVEVSNANAIPVRDYRTPYQLEKFVSPCQLNDACTITFDPVPDGKRLVVTFVSGFTDVTNGTLPNCNLMSSLGSKESAMVVIPFQRGAVTTSATRMVANQQILAYFGPGETPSANCTLFSTGDTFRGPSFQFSIAGYLEPL